MTPTVGKKLFTAILLSVIMAAATVTSAQAAGQTLTFSTIQNSADTLISEVILRLAYRRLGIDVNILKLPAKRAVYMANNGETDGEVQRSAGLSREGYDNLIQIYPPINYTTATVFTSGKVFPLDQGWESLRPYHIAMLLGIKSFEERTAGMRVQSVADYTQVVRLIEGGRDDIAVLDRMNGRFWFAKLGVPVTELTPPLERFPEFHYLHKKHRDLVSKIADIFSEMQNDGTLQKIHDHVIRVTIERVKQGLPVCDDDYACYEEGLN